MFKELYYWILTSFKKSKKNTETDFNAMLWLMILEIMNITTVLSAINCYLRIKPAKEIMVYIGIIISLLMFSINYFYLYKQRQDIKIKYEILSQSRKNVGKWLTRLYTILTFVLFYIFGNCVASVLSK